MLIKFAILWVIDNQIGEEKGVEICPTAHRLLRPGGDELIVALYWPSAIKKIFIFNVSEYFLSERGLNIV